jgi:hypothetical protein
MVKVIGSEKGKDKKSSEPVADSAGNLTAETFRQSVAELALANEGVAAANEVRKRVRKTIKARGIELGDLDETMKKADWDREEVRAQFERRLRYARWLGLPVEAQGDMFKGMSQEEKSAAEYEATGRTAFLAAKRREAPEDVPEPFKPNWLRGYDIAAGKEPEVAAAKEGKAKAKDERAAAKERTADESDGSIKAPKPDPVSEAAFADEDELAKARREKTAAAAKQDASVIQ